MTQIITQLSPILAIVGTAIFILILISIWREINGELLLTIAVCGLAVSIWFGSKMWFSGGMDHLAITGFILFAVAGGLALISAYNYIVGRGLPWPEYLVLILFAIFGAGVMASGKNLVTIFIGLETLSVSAYVLAGYDKRDPSSTEAAIKYFVMGATASAILLFGIAFYYGATGTVELVRQSEVVNNKMFLLAIGLIFSGFAFKVAAVPFQWWTPDVYQGSPLPVTTFFATAVKAAGFIALFRVMTSVVPVADISPFLAVIAIATMTFANMAALFQEDVKRMLAYSSIAHAGYILLAFVVLKGNAIMAQSAMLFYLFAYILMTAGAFSVLVLMPSSAISGFMGLSRRSPWLALSFTLFLLSLAGFPPTAGFVAKFYLFKAVVQQGYVALVIVAVINSLVSVYYYMRPVVSMYFHSGDARFSFPESINYSTIGVVIFCLVGVLFFGLWPSIIIIWLIN